MLNLEQLLDALKSNKSKNVTVNIFINNDTDFADDVDDVDEAPDLPDTDFEVDDRVLVCHVRKNGDRVHTVGTVIETCGYDDKGWYTRVLGDNGKHYRAGLTYNAERLGTIIYQLDD